MWEDGFCRGSLDGMDGHGEDLVRKAFSKMSIQLYNYGEGWVLTIGRFSSYFVPVCLCLWIFALLFYLSHSSSTHFFLFLFPFLDDELMMMIRQALISIIIWCVSVCDICSGDVCLSMYSNWMDKKWANYCGCYVCLWCRLMGKVASDKCHKWVFKEPTESSSSEPNISNYWQSSFDAVCIYKCPLYHLLFTFHFFTVE